MLFLHAFSQEVFFIFVNFAYFNLKKNKSSFIDKSLAYMGSDRFFFVKIMSLFLILRKFYNLRFSLKIWNSYILFLMSSLNCVFNKCLPSPVDTSFSITSLNARSYFTNKIVFFFKRTKTNYSLLMFKYFLYAMVFINSSVKHSLLVTNFIFYKPYEFMILFFYFKRFSSKRLRRRMRRRKTARRRYNHIYI